MESRNSESSEDAVSNLALCMAQRDIYTAVYSLSLKHSLNSDLKVSSGETLLKFILYNDCHSTSNAKNNNNGICCPVPLSNPCF